MLELVVFSIVIVILTAILLAAVAVVLQAMIVLRDRGGNQSRRSPGPGTQLVGLEVEEAVVPVLSVMAGAQLAVVSLEEPCPRQMLLLAVSAPARHYSVQLVSFLPGRCRP